MRYPTSASEDRAYGAEKIGSSRYSDFFNLNRPISDISRHTQSLIVQSYAGSKSSGAQLRVVPSAARVRSC